MQKLEKERERNYGSEESRGWRKGVGRETGGRVHTTELQVLPGALFLALFPEESETLPTRGKQVTYLLLLPHLYLIKLCLSASHPRPQKEASEGGGRQAGWKTGSLSLENCGVGSDVVPWQRAEAAGPSL